MTQEQDKISDSKFCHSVCLFGSYRAYDGNPLPPALTYATLRHLAPLAVPTTRGVDDVVQSVHGRITRVPGGRVLHSGRVVDGGVVHVTGWTAVNCRKYGD